MKITLPHQKPRNPLVVASLRRNAGSHRKSNASQRQAASRALKTELHRATEHGPPNA
jgi:hypothetical protein